MSGWEVGERISLSKVKIESCLSSASKVHSFIQQIQSASLQRAGAMVVNEDRSPCPSGAFILVEEDNKGFGGTSSCSSPARHSLTSGPCTHHCLWLLLEALLETPSLGLAPILWLPMATRAALAQYTFLWVCSPVRVTVTPEPRETSRDRGQVCLGHHSPPSVW